MSPRSLVPLLAAALTLASAAATTAEYRLETIAAQLHHPWSVAQLPDGDFLVTERRGKLYRIAADGSARSEITAVPATYVAGQGGFFDIVLHPRFADNKLLYLAYARGDGNANGTAVMRVRLDDDQLRDSREILWVANKKNTAQHYGGRLLFLPDGTLLLTTGDGFDFREQAQATSSELGKVLRIHDDGRVPRDNPFSDPGSERVWSLGHRNPQGLALTADGIVYLLDHGPRGGDELNRLQPGNNYGWPAATHGVDYSGALVSPFTDLPGMTPPLHYWVPSIAPSGMTWYDGDRFPQWRGRLLVGALAGMEARLLELEAGQVVGERALFTELGERIRDVRSGSDGFVYLLTDSEEGQLIRVRPAP